MNDNWISKAKLIRKNSPCLFCLSTFDDEVLLMVGGHVITIDRYSYGYGYEFNRGRQIFFDNMFELFEFVLTEFETSRKIKSIEV